MEEIRGSIPLESTAQNLRGKMEGAGSSRPTRKSQACESLRAGKSPPDYIMTTVKKAGYEYLLAYKISVPIYDYTVVFCKRHKELLSSTRTFDQMVQASRSGNTNIPEGNQQASLEGYIKLTGVSSASLEELLKDFHSFARQNQIPVWNKEETVRKVREVGIVWEILNSSPTLPNQPDFPDLPNNLTGAVNLMVTLVNQAIYMQKKLKASLEEKFVHEGGFRENLFKKRMTQKLKTGQ